MCTGSAYCQMIHMLWPDKMPIKKVKFAAKLEHAYIDNWKVLQDSFKKLRIEKDVAIQRLVKGRFQDNFEFLQWFYKFFTINDSGEHEYDAVSVRGGTGGPPPNRSPVKRAPGPKSQIKKAAPTAAAVSNVKRSGSNSNSSEAKKLKEQVVGLEDAVASLEKERDFYFGKLRDIEVLCQEKEGDEVFAQFSAAIIEILYATEEGFGAAEDEFEPEDADEEEQEEY